MARTAPGTLGDYAAVASQDMTENTEASSTGIGAGGRAPGTSSDPPAPPSADGTTIMEAGGAGTETGDGELQNQQPAPHAGGRAPGASSDSLAPSPPDGTTDTEAGGAVTEAGGAGTEASGAGTETGDDEPRHRQPGTEARSLRRRLGIDGILTLIPGSVVLLLVVLAEAALWQEAAWARQGGEPRRPWINIFTRNWTTTSITISTAIVRTIVALQAGLVAALLAAIILESIGAPLRDGPFYSIVRALTVSPLTLLLRSSSWPKGILAFSVYALLVTEVLVTLACQFLSTLLVSDLANAPVVGLSVPLTDTIFLDQSPTFNMVQLWQAPPTSSWTFAEVSGSHLQKGNFDNTGNTYRALLPLNEGRRKRLRRFHGPAPILDSQVACFRPQMRNITMRRPGPLLTGFVGISSGQIGNQMLMEPTSMNINCEIPDGNLYAAGTSLCYPNSGMRPSHMPSLKPGQDISTIPVNIPLDPFYLVNPSRQASEMFVMVNIGSIPAMDGLVPNSTADSHWPDNVWHDDGPWAVASSNLSNDAVRVTACIASLGYKTLTVDINSSVDAREPRVTWDSLAAKYDTGASRIQLGASSKMESFQERGVLSLAPVSQWEHEDKTTQNNDSDYFRRAIEVSFPARLGNLPQQADSGVLLSKITPGAHEVEGTDQAHPAHVDLFHDVLGDTGSPALALQALLTRLCQMAYYERLDRTNTTAPASVSFSSSVLIPVRWTGFSAATALVAAHFVLVVAVTVLFLRLARDSLIGNSWQAVSQAVSEDTRPLLEQAGAMTDKDIEAWAKRRSLGIARPAGLAYRRNGRRALGLLDGKAG
ncbi:hypothetical protein HRG_006239 [Hirsutella rhossiliensis]|uniref:Uncharacterized protein n=1 Tax=Hirsutella rhossiliensis TaxID=111463 RepID=A0A9P8MYT7_9HYPO|nr:uncharacterized protein HRG_06239 [Hirsutella rhossiliensis]KAH0963729.1 hypothetical protein HRG_06239 [Hirsutella rhossiliensis]